MALRDEFQHRSPKDVPPVGRPRGAVWRSLQADGVVWEGQVLLVGGEVDLAARMIVTHRRVAFVRGGDLVLEIPRGWLRQEPVLRRDGVLELFVATPESNPFDEPMRVPLRMREGHPAAGHIIAMLAPGGVRRITPDTVSPIERARESAPAASYGGFWEGVEAVPEIRRDDFLNDARSLTGIGGSPDEDTADVAELPPIEPPDRLLRVSSAPQRRQHEPTFPIAGLMPRDQRRSPWTLLLRVAALTILLATAAALGAGRLNIRLPGSGGNLEAVLAVPSPTATPSSTNSAPASVSATELPDSALTPSDLTAVAIGVGGPAAQTTAEAIVAVAQATVAPAGEPSPTPAQVVVPTEAVIPTPALESAPPATPASTPAVAAPAPTDEPAVAASPENGAGTPAAAPLEQPAAVAADLPPAQEIVVGPIRFAVTTALRAESLPRYGLPPGSGTWVLVIANLTNDGDEPASLGMNDLRIFDRGTGTVADLDAGTDVIAGLAGITPPRGAADVITLEPGDSTEVLLLFLQPPGGSEDLVLLIDQASLDLTPSLALESAEAAAAPILVEATVTEVIDGERIAVDIDGLLRQVKYLGMAAPTGDACFAAESAAANGQLVEGQQVWLERQATDRDDEDTLLRDVWINDAAGNRDLVAARLLEIGAATPTAAPPDTRYQAWLAASTALARTNGAGLWGACGQAAAISNGTTNVLLGVPPGSGSEGFSPIAL